MDARLLPPVGHAGSRIVATLEPVVLLRAGMDAVPGATCHLFFRAHAHRLGPAPSAPTTLLDAQRIIPTTGFSTSEAEQSTPTDSRGLFLRFVWRAAASAIGPLMSPNLFFFHGHVPLDTLVPLRASLHHIAP